MKKSLLILGAMSLSISGISQAADQINEQVLREKAAFALGVTQDRVTLEQSDRTPEPSSYFFNARYQGKRYQCYFATMQAQIMSDAVCRPTDGSDLPR
ncbi:hypothetical protein [Enterobacter cloacae]|uniref:hypothetical protein n=1 Tax=Enterobacter cloacae TaxID=550 RepID=UPI002B1EF5EB|nr:hypothetical protein [Enterobacter cloacae]MEA5217546.1 hypothetical protein [Enterobacter cloacae]